LGPAGFAQNPGPHELGLLAYVVKACARLGPILTVRKNKPLTCKHTNYHNVSSPQQTCAIQYMKCMVICHIFPVLVFLPTKIWQSCSPEKKSFLFT
jgi:hypothetical protein